MPYFFSDMFNELVVFKIVCCFLESQHSLKQQLSTLMEVISVTN